jgi:para-aminobenzoate synthetase component 1
MKLFSFELNNYSTEQIFLSLCDKPHFVFLDGDDPTHPHGQFGFMGFDPVKIYNPDTIQFDDINNDFMNFKPTNNIDFPFTGGLMGFLSYEFGYECNEITNPFIHQGQIPQFQFGLYNKVIGIDYKNNKIYFFVTYENEIIAKKKYNELIENIYIDHRELYSSQSVSLTPEIEKNKYIKIIQKTIDYIKDGDIFQANIAQTFSAERNTIHIQSLYLKAREQNSAPYSAYLNQDYFHILSSSPECFLSLQNSILKTRPIKGTLSTSKDKAILENSTKDRAENIMIVDLMRNDFSKICDDNSITVEKLCSVETFKGLHHLVSTVSGRLKQPKTIFDALKACFPAGSITGAPKIRAMEIIAELENKPRDIFCGSIGYISYNGNAEFNVAIRTLLITKDKITLWAGGGITSLSDPQDEYDETILKASKWRRILTA